MQSKNGKLKRDNSNIRAVSDELWRALRKLNKLNKLNKVHGYPMCLDAYIAYLKVTGTCVVNPYPALDFDLDVQAFKETLPLEEQELLRMFMEGYSAKEIAANSKWALKSVYRRLKGIYTKFGEFYEEYLYV